MRAACLLLALIACKKAEPPPKVTAVPATPSAVPDDAANAGAAPVRHVDLLRFMPMTVRVSSSVANPKILPAHLVDRDLKTAWNSATGQLVGSWIEIVIPPGAEVTELRVTSGFTALGPKGEDYFTMNPRIKQLHITDNGPTRTVALDIDQRGLQTIAVSASVDLRIEIAEIVPGSNKAWREASMSELELWGTPPEGWTTPTPPHVPLVEVGAEPIEDTCAEIDAQREAFIEAHKDDVHEGPGAEDHAYPPECGILDVGKPDELPAPWNTADGWCEIHDEVYGPKACYVKFRQAGVSAIVGVEGPHSEAKVEISSTLSLQDILPGGGAEMIVRFRHPPPDPFDRMRLTESIAICRAAPKLACSAEILVSTEDWRTRETFVKGELVLAKGTGDPPAGVIGRHPLVFK